MAKDVAAWARAVARRFGPDHWKGLRWLSKRPQPYMFPNGGVAHASLVLKGCAKEPTAKKPYWRLSVRGEALMDYASELGRKLELPARSDLIASLWTPILFRDLAKSLRAFRPHLVVPSSIDLHSSRVTNIGYGVAHAVMTDAEHFKLLSSGGVIDGQR